MSKKKLTEKDKAIQARKLLEARPGFKWKIIETQIKWRISKFDKESGEDIEKNINMIPRQKILTSGGEITWSSPEKGTQFYEDVIEILKALHLRERYWLEPVSNYILYGNFGESYSESETRVSLEHETYPISKQAIVKIIPGKNTTIEDIKRIWSDIAQWQDVLYSYRPPKFKYKKNLDRDLDILALSQKNGIKISDIWSYISRKYPGEDLDYSNIRKIISSLRKEFNIKGKKIKTAKFNVGNITS